MTESAQILNPVAHVAVTEASAAPRPQHVGGAAPGDSGEPQGQRPRADGGDGRRAALARRAR